MKYQNLWSKESTITIQGNAMWRAGAIPFGSPEFLAGIQIDESGPWAQSDHCKKCSQWSRIRIDEGLTKSPFSTSSQDWQKYP